MSVCVCVCALCVVRVSVRVMPPTRIYDMEPSLYL